MYSILSHQHMSMPIWTSEDDERDYHMPSAFIHVHVTVIRHRMRSVLDDKETDHDAARVPYRSQYARLPKQKVSQHKKPLPIKDKRISDPRFQKKYRWN